MRTIKLGSVIGMLAFSTLAYADSQVTTVIDGTPVDKELVKMTFNDTTVTLTFSDNSTQTAEMSLVAVTLNHSSAALNDIIADQEKAEGVYNLHGQYLGKSPEGLQPGFYIVDGNKIYVK